METSMTATAKVTTEGGDIVYDYEGHGPVLLTIAGGGGDASRYAGISRLLQDDYTVVRYDRRCNSRSTGDRSQPLDMAQQARDAAAVIRAMGNEPAYVFGNSGGGAIALKLAELHPELVRGMIVHEPSILTVLPDAPEWLAFAARVESTFETQGVGPAMRLFAGSLVGFGGPAIGAGNRIGDASSDANLEFFLRREYHDLSLYRPDLARIRDNNLAMIAVAGRASEDAYYARTAQVLAERVGCAHAVVAGNHIAFVSDPATFAAELRGLLDQVKAQPNAR